MRRDDEEIGVLSRVEIEFQKTPEKDQPVFCCQKRCLPRRYIKLTFEGTINLRVCRINDFLSSGYMFSLY